MCDNEVFVNFAKLISFTKSRWLIKFDLFSKLFDSSIDLIGVLVNVIYYLGKDIIGYVIEGY